MIRHISFVIPVLTFTGCSLFSMFTPTKALPASETFLFDFTGADNDVNDWRESSDTVREVGKSKASFVIQKTQVFQRAIFFTLLNPQPNGAAFAGVNHYFKKNLSNYDSLVLRVRPQGENTGYKIVLRHKGQNFEPNPSYETTFEVTKNEFQDISLPLKEFKAYYRGKPVPDAPELDKSDVTAIGLQVYGGVYQPKKQSGVSSLEIDWIKAVKTETD